MAEKKFEPIYWQNHLTDSHQTASIEDSIYFVAFDAYIFVVFGNKKNYHKIIFG